MLPHKLAEVWRETKRFRGFLKPNHGNDVEKCDDREQGVAPHRFHPTIMSEGSGQVVGCVVGSGSVQIDSEEMRFLDVAAT